MSYIVFPGNVGNNESLRNVAERLGVPKKSTSSILRTFRQCEIQHIRTSNKTFKMLQNAKAQRPQAIAAFNIYNLEGAKAVVDAAQELESPVIIQVSARRE